MYCSLFTYACNYMIIGTDLLGAMGVNALSRVPDPLLQPAGDLVPDLYYRGFVLDPKPSHPVHPEPKTKVGI